MGLCASHSDSDANPEARFKSKDLDKQINKHHSEDSTISKLLLLGAGDSGKSTLFKQMKTIYGVGFTQAERMQYVGTVHNNLIVAFKTLVEQADSYGGIQRVDLKKLVEESKDVTLVGPVAQAMKILWDEPAVKKAYSNRSKFVLYDSTSYFVGRLDDVWQTGYLPTEADIFRSRVPTTGIVETSFVIDGNKFRIIDVGGQRSERKKWVHCFEGVTAVLFVANIGAYDQTLYEEADTPCVTEALNLYESIVNNEWFGHTSIILFLNKRDIFAEKYDTTPLSNYFPEYKGSSVDDGCEFFKELFHERNHAEESADDKYFYVHVTCATDTNNVIHVFNCVKDIVIKGVLNLLV
jgi:GTPase SAR1 family protein